MRDISTLYATQLMATTDPHLFVCKEDGEPSLRMWALSCLIEDRQEPAPSYNQFLTVRTWLCAINWTDQLLTILCSQGKGQFDVINLELSVIDDRKWMYPVLTVSACNFTCDMISALHSVHCIHKSGSSASSHSSTS